MIRKEVRITEETARQIAAHVEDLGLLEPHRGWTEADFMRLCLGIGCQITTLSLDHARAPDSGPDIDAIIAQAWAEYMEGK